ncbi:MAG: DNA polymerase III subunit delta [Patescibacteria group bacterium]
MIILAYGDDTFRVKEKVKQLKDAFVKKHDPSGMNVAVFPNERSAKLDPAEILQSLCSYPFLGSKRLVIIQDLISTTKKAEQAQWEEGFQRMPDSTIAVLFETGEPKAIEKKPFFTSLLKMSEVHTYPFPHLEGAALVSWITDRVKTFGGSIDRSAAQELAVRVSSDLWHMSHEIEKLIAYASGKMITISMVEELVRASFEGQIFGFMDAISKKQTGLAIKLLSQERSAGSDDHYLLTMLGRQVRILLSTRSLLDENSSITKQEIASALGMHPFVAQKAMEQARAFSFSQLVMVHDFLFEFDQKIKSGRMGVELAVDLTADALLA